MEQFPSQSEENKLPTPPQEVYLDVNTPTRELSVEEKREEEERNKDLPPPPLENNSIV
ncbi:MAG: hypothetical protein QG563_385 [Patescibacteria group bacterium]|nr:hypothetical protein [Patescibacteria group bacterium]